MVGADSFESMETPKMNRGATSVSFARSKVVVGAPINS